MDFQAMTARNLSALMMKRATMWALVKRMENAIALQVDIQALIAACLSALIIMTATIEEIVQMKSVLALKDFQAMIASFLIALMMHHATRLHYVLVEPVFAWLRFAYPVLWVKLLMSAPLANV